ncbi:ralBP1-associated Eps domain-containing protein 2 isoform X2 [Pantherophis guttatus]|uniref:RalBP1-associated Eps domain-containing protein 2 isoform X2 n=1 Tax=Pantherophis guttatus TaxID=94885 RepID=A0A6P9DGW3_PANGU|nr:ralBP1-associated Eps domain-containing protein 2 isoform X2 [Pantherophis guttatus]
MEPAGTALTGPAAAGTSAFFLARNEQQCFSELFSLCGGQPTPEAGPGLGPPAVGGSKVAELFRASQLPAEMLHQITDLCGAKHVGYFGRTQFYAALKLIAAAQSGLPVRIESIQNELPLPRFSALKSDSEIRYINLSEAHGAKFQSPHTILEINCFRRSDEEEKQEEAKSPPMSPIGSHPASPSNYQRIPLGYGYSILRSGLEQQHGGSYEARHSIQDGLTSGNYGPKSMPTRSCVIQSLSIEREPKDSSSNYPDDLWRVTEEQRDYYINQFKSLQLDLNSFISGSVAKNFFTKSKLPIHELSHIWELSDVDCDGALTLAEFCAAFHLVVARKNGYLLPGSLPETLLPDYLHADLKVSDSTQAVPKELKVPQCLPFKTVAQESNILKMRPRSRSYSSTSVEDTVNKGGEPPVPPPRPQKSHSRASSLDLNRIFQQNTQVRSGWIPPPPALPPRPFVSQVSLPLINTAPNMQPKSSYMNFSLQEQIEQDSEINSHLPMNMSPSQESSPAKKDLVLTQLPSKSIYKKFRPESHMLENQEVSPTKSATSSSLTTIKLHHAFSKQSSKQKKAIQTAIRKNKEANAVLVRLNSELQQQLKEVHKERIALETQLEQHRPVTVL